MKEIILKLIDQVLGNDKVLIVIAITAMGIYCAYVFQNNGKDVISNCVSGLLGMAIGQKLTPSSDLTK